MEKAYIFVDECGNSALSLEKAGTFSHFVYTAVVIRESALEEAERCRQNISTKYCQGQPIKASRLSTQEKIDSLSEIIRLNPIIYTLVIDKIKIDSDGLKIRQSFYKYFQKIFLLDIVKNYSSFDITLDKFGYPDFQRSLQEYISKHVVQRDLFAPDKCFKICEDKFEVPLLQLADIAANCLGNIYCVSHQDQRYLDIFNVLKKNLVVDFFPGEINFFINEPTTTDAEINKQIWDIATKSVFKFIENASFDNKPELKAILNYILMVNQSNPEQLIPSYDLIEIARRYDPLFSQFQLRQVIALFRDNEVLITSLHGKMGYKIPNKPDDLISFFNRFISNVIPMLKRMAIANEILKKNSDNNIDLITNNEDMRLLSTLLEIVYSRIPQARHSE